MRLPKRLVAAALTSAAVGPHSNVGSAHVNGLILAAFARARSAFLTCCDNLMISIHLFSRARSSASSQPPGLSWIPRRHPIGSDMVEEHDDDDCESLEELDDEEASEEELPTELSSSSSAKRRGPAAREGLFLVGSGWVGSSIPLFIDDNVVDFVVSSSLSWLSFWPSSSNTCLLLSAIVMQWCWCCCCKYFAGNNQ